jgi:hypothetical protein
MSTVSQRDTTKSAREFRVAFSADFRREDGDLAFPDIRLPLLDAIPEVK